MNPSRVGADRAAPALPLSRQPAAGPADVRLGGGRHPALGLHHPLPQRGVSQPGFNFVPALLGAVLLWDFLTRVMQGVTMAFFEDVWSRNFLNFFATPLRTSEYLAGLVHRRGDDQPAGPRRHAGPGAGRRSACRSSPTASALAPFLMVLFLTGIALGIAGAAIVLRLGPASEWLIWPIPTLVSPFAGVFYPVTVLPAWMQAIARYCRRPMCSKACGRWSPASPRPGTAWRSAAASRSSTSSSLACFFFAGLSLRHPHRPDRPLQRRDLDLSRVPWRSGAQASAKAMWVLAWKRRTVYRGKFGKRAVSQGLSCELTGERLCNPGRCCARVGDGNEHQICRWRSFADCARRQSRQGPAFGGCGG